MGIYVGREAICPICKKLFIIPVENTYKLKVKDKLRHYCSYTCFRVDQKKLEQSTK